jgi:hypothetical protein
MKAVNIDTRVWLSATAHVRHFREVVAASGGPRGQAKLSYATGQLPHVAPLWGLLGFRFPTPYLAHGHLSVTASSLQFQSTPPRLFGNRVANLRVGLQWDIPLGRIVAVEPYPLSSPVNARFDLLFAHVRTGEAGFAGDFLVCSARRKYDPTVQREDSRQLLESLQVAVSRAGWGAAPA